MTVFASMLRAVNVGGRSIKMAPLKALYEELGLTEVRTLLQSGNVVFDGGRTGRAALTRRIEDAIEATFGFRSDVMLRSAAELGDIAARNPFRDEAESDPSHLVVMTLAGAPDAGAVARLADILVGPERALVSGSEVFVYYPKGIGTSKLTNVRLEKALGVRGTARNWNTIVKIAALAGSPGKA